MSQAQAHIHTLATFGDLHAEVRFDDYDACKGMVVVQPVDNSTVCEFAWLFQNPTERDFGIAGAFEVLAKLAKTKAFEQRVYAIKNGFAH